MASKVIYPPTVSSYIPAFENGPNAVCRVYFSLSKFNSRADFQSVHISVTKQGSGASVVNKQDAPPRYRATGIILNAQAIQVESNLYYVDITSEDVKQSNNQNKSWETGWIYKIQIRLSGVNYDGVTKQSSWINDNANNFSEWSTVCVTKVIGVNKVTIPLFNYSSTDDSANSNVVLNLSTLDITGSYSNTDTSEMLYSYQMKLLQNNEVLEDSGILYPNQYINSNQFNYLFRKALQEGDYIYEMDYETHNKYQGSIQIRFSFNHFNVKEMPLNLLSAETGAESTIYEEEEEGRVGLQLEVPAGISFFGNVCLRRASELSEYTEWEDIKIIPITHKMMAEDYKYPIIYDYTAISGIRYKYGIQMIDEYDTRGSLQVIEEPIKREYLFSYILGENEQQLKLRFDNAISNFKITVGDFKTDTIGGQYPFITRNGNMKYKTFGLSGLISYNMDEANLFLGKEFMGREAEGLYDYTYEREFRAKVLEFLYSDKPKLFKSPTEGNILVRIMDVQTDPNKTLNRMIYSFSANAHEIAEPTLKNYLEYNLTSISEANSDYQILGYQTQIGQYSKTYTLGDDILKLICNQHTYQTGDTSFKVKGITNLRLTIDGKPLSVGGWELNINSNKILLPGFLNTFEPELDFTTKDTISISKDAQVKTIDIIVDYEYTIEERIIIPKIEKTLSYAYHLGQLSETYATETSLYREIINKYYIESDTHFRYNRSILKIVIEAPTGTSFTIKYTDSTEQIVFIEETGLLVLNDVQDIEDIICNDEASILVDYLCQVAQGTYREE